MNGRISAVARTALAAALVAVLAAPAADARPGGGRSSGSRGSATSSAPPTTTTAPRTAQPMQRTETPSTAPRPGAPAPAAAAPSRGMGFGGGFVAGLLGAGLLGAMFGGGFFGGLGGLSSMLGLLLQAGLIVGLVWLALRFFRRRSEPAMAGAGAPYARSGLGGPMPLGGGSGPRPGAQPQRQPIDIGPEDYRAFEKNLQDVQISYGRGDLGALRRLSTSEMARYFEQDLAEDRARGVRNEVSQPKLLQGDLAEAWREGATSYATVAMRFEIVDVMVDAASGRVVSGNRSAPTEATEIWTFRRDDGGPWLLSAIQQTA